MVTPDEFVAQTIRSLAETLRSLDYKIQAAKLSWDAGMDTEIANDSTLYDERTGIAGLAGSDVHAVFAIYENIKGVMDATGARAKVEKPCVRPLNAE